MVGVNGVRLSATYCVLCIYYDSGGFVSDPSSGSASGNPCVTSDPDLLYPPYLQTLATLLVVWYKFAVDVVTGDSRLR